MTTLISLWIIQNSARAPSSVFTSCLGSCSPKIISPPRWSLIGRRWTASARIFSLAKWFGISPTLTRLRHRRESRETGRGYSRGLVNRSRPLTWSRSDGTRWVSANCFVRPSCVHRLHCTPWVPQQKNVCNRNANHGLLPAKNLLLLAVSYYLVLISVNYCFYLELFLCIVVHWFYSYTWLSDVRLNLGGCSRYLWWKQREL